MTDGSLATRRNALMAFTGLVSSSSVSNTILRPGNPCAFTHASTPAFSSVAADANAPDSDATTPILKSVCAAAGPAMSISTRRTRASIGTFSQVGVIFDQTTLDPSPQPPPTTGGGRVAG